MRHRGTLIALVLVAVVAIAGARPVMRAIEAAMLLNRLAMPIESGGVDLRAVRRELVFAMAGRSYRADLYRSADEPRAALLLVPGLAPDGKDDRRLVELADALAQARFAVLVPDLASLREQRVSPDNVGQIADALRFLASDDGHIAPADRPRGIAAISYAVGPALLATLRPEIAGRIDFLVGIGGYYDVVSVVAYFTTGSYRDGPEAPWRQGTPNEFGKWLFVRANAVNVADLRDRTSLMAMAGRRMRNPTADIADLAVKLGPEGRAVHALLSNQDPDRTGELIDALPDRLRAGLLGLDLRGRSLAGAPAKVLLIHGRDDPIIPASESQALAAALPPEKSALFMVDNLQHANLRPGGWLDVWVLWRAVYRLLQIRDD
ncbi:MAG: hypothetical protein ACREEE_03715 [Dongiaceae bacterium]